MRHIIEALLRELVSAPGSLEVSELETDEGVTYEVRAAAEDRGRVIGKEGAHAKALRTLLHAAGTRQGRKFRLVVVEE